MNLEHWLFAVCIGSLCLCLLNFGGYLVFALLWIGETKRSTNNKWKPHMIVSLAGSLFFLAAMAIIVGAAMVVT